MRGSPKVHTIFSISQEHDSKNPIGLLVQEKLKDDYYFFMISESC
jgi:hypothetical protein